MKCVIVCAAKITNYEKIKTYFNSDDYYIFCDGGLNHQEKLGVIPNLIVGDFDSHQTPDPQIYNKSEIICLPREKDWTDSYFAAMEGIKRGFKEFLLVGVIGQRFDHSLCNISTLLYLQENGAHSIVIDDYSEMELINQGQTYYVPDTFEYFSLLCVSGNVSGLTIKNAKYLAENAEVKTSFQYTTSNEVLPDQKAEITIQQGIMLLIKIYY